MSENEISKMSADEIVHRLTSYSRIYQDNKDLNKLVAEQRMRLRELTGIAQNQWNVITVMGIVVGTDLGFNNHELNQGKIHYEFNHHGGFPVGTLARVVGRIESVGSDEGETVVYLDVYSYERAGSYTGDGE